MKKYYEVSIKYNDSIFGSNIAFAENENDIKAHYEAKGYEIIATTEVSERTVESARERGKPIVEMEHVEVTEDAEKEVTEDAEEVTNIEDAIIDLRKEVRYKTIDVDCLCDYNSGYLFDLEFDIVDSYIGIYYSDLEQWLHDTHTSYDYMEQAVIEYGINNKNYSFADHMRTAQAIQLGEEYRENISIYKSFYILHALQKQGLEVLTTEQRKIIDESITDVDTIEDLTELVNSVLEVVRC